MQSKILIVVDMQNDFIDGILGTKEAQKIVQPVVEYIQNYRGQILITQDIHNKLEYSNSTESKYCPIHCLKGTAGACINLKAEDALPISNIYQKHTYGCTNMAQDITYRPDNTVIEIVGLCTDICVISNALLIRAFNPNKRIIVHADMCAGTTPEKHKEALDVMKSCGIEVVGE